MFPNVEVAGPGGVPERAGRAFLNQVLDLVTALLLFAVIIALFGI